MASYDDTVLQLPIDQALKEAFVEAAHRERTTAAETLEQLMRDYVRRSQREEAGRQSAVVASAPDAEETMNALMEVQGFARD